jgi:hypothetical protein
MKINTNTLLIAAAAAVGLYLLTRPKTPVYPPGYNPYQTALPGSGYNPYQQPNQTAAIISAGGGALESISDLLGNFF